MAEAALERLREAIIMGELTPGTPLRLEDLAGRLGMSISPIREAVRRLEALGLAELVPHQGAKVVALDTEDLRDLFEVRLGLETTALRRASARFSAADFMRPRGARPARPPCARGHVLRARARRALAASSGVGAGAFEEPPMRRRLEQLLRDERARSGPETRPGPRARADVPEPVDGCAVAGVP